MSWRNVIKKVYNFEQDEDAVDSFLLRKATI